MILQAACTDKPTVRNEGVARDLKERNDRIHYRNRFLENLEISDVNKNGIFWVGYAHKIRIQEWMASRFF